MTGAPTGRRRAQPDPAERRQPPNASPELERARELLADGGWHDYEQVMRELVKVIPPGRAVREADSLRVAQVRKRARYAGRTPPDKPARQRHGDLDRIRTTGARAIIRKMLNGAEFDIDPPGRAERKRIRLPDATGRRRRSAG